MSKTLKEHLFDDFNVDLDNAGGNGKSAENAIIINKSIWDYTAAGYYIVTLIYRAIDKSWETKTQEIIEVNGRNIDKLTIEVVNGNKSKQLTDFYFDISSYTN